MKGARRVVAGLRRAWTRLAAPVDEPRIFDGGWLASYYLEAAYRHRRAAQFMLDTAAACGDGPDVIAKCRAKVAALDADIAYLTRRAYGGDA